MFNGGSGSHDEDRVGMTTKGAEFKKCIAVNSHGETRLDHVKLGVKEICLCAVVDAMSTSEIANNLKKQLACYDHFQSDRVGGHACLVGICPSLHQNEDSADK